MIVVTFPRTRTEAEIRERRDHMRKLLPDWTEPNGLLVPTEPDPLQRALIRRDLAASIWTLGWVLGEPE